MAIAQARALTHARGCCAVAVAIALGAPAVATAATARGYVPESSKSFDYSYSVRTPAGVTTVRRGDGALDFRKGGRTIVRARLCAESADNDPGTALRSEATDAKVKLVRVGAGVYRAGSQYWTAVRGGSCLRFSTRTGVSTALARRLALHTNALLGRRGRTPASEPAGLALAERTNAVSRATARATASGTGGLCHGRGLSCTQVSRPGSVVFEAAVDLPAKYSFTRATLPGTPTATIVTRGTKEWVALGSAPCWLGPLPLDEADAVTADDFGLDLDSWRIRFGTPVARPDGTTSIGFAGYWQRGVAVVDAAGHVVEVQLVEREDPGVTVSVRVLATFPAAITQVATTPAC